MNHSDDKIFVFGVLLLILYNKTNYFFTKMNSIELKKLYFTIPADNFCRTFFTVRKTVKYK